ncbi:MAG: tRNA (N6-isopentenyl adenosine(37)-C2)-methylthiotransferase MiaB [Eubacteriales bacterium]
MKETQKNKYYYVTTYGCQMNSHESEKVEGMLGGMGYIKGDAAETADVLVVNTCCVRESAESKIVSNIGALRKLKKKRPNMVIIVCGCMTQQKDLSKRMFQRFNHVNIIIGTQNMHRIPDFLEETLETGKRKLEIEADQLKVYEDIPVKRYNKPFAFVNIMYGCDNYCAYCIVPYVRGGERSRKPEKILEEIDRLAEQGYKEITLLGQNVNSYGKGLDEPYDFARLLTEIEKRDAIKRVRFMTSHPKDLSDDLIEVIKNRKSVCNHIHLPVQSGSSRVLKLMNRKYDRAHYLDVVEKLKKASPDIAITTDIIVGFPGETEEDFLETISLVEKVGFDSSYTFKYSKRSGTKAEKMDGHLDEETKTDRIMRLLEVTNQLTYDTHKTMVGKTCEVLVEGEHKDRGQMFGRSDGFKLVNFEGSPDLKGQFVQVKITKAMKNSVFGELV